MNFLETPVSLSADHRTFDELVSLILRGKEQYTVRHEGRLTIIYPLAPRHPLNRILTVQLHHFRFTAGSVSLLEPYLGNKIREATGCHLEGGFVNGLAMDIGIPEISLSSAVFADIVARVANADVPTMWVVVPDSGERGCILDPWRMWQVGIYGDGEAEPPLRWSSGPQLVR